MIRARRQLDARLRPVLLVVLLAVAPLLAGLPAQQAATAGPRIPAVAPVGTGNLVISLSRMRPAVAQPDSTLDVRGTVTNVSDAPVADVAVALRISPTPLYNRSEIAQVLSGNTTREGIRIEATIKQVTQSLGPGAAAEFKLSLPLADVSLPRAGVYVTAVEALGNGNGYQERQALYRTFLPWWPPDTTAEPLGLTMLWPITGPPERDAYGTYLNDSLGVQMSATGRLDTLVAAAGTDPGTVTWVLDPQVVQAAAGMATGYRVYQGDAGKPVPGTRSREAARWLAALSTAVTDDSPTVMASLYGYPDVDAAKEGRALGNLLSQRLAANTQMALILDRDLDGDLVVAPGGNATPDAIGTLREAGVLGLALSDTAMPANEQANYTRSGSANLDTPDGPMPTLLLDSGLQAGLAMPAESSSDAIALRQRLLAETEVAALEAPAEARILVAAPADDWAPSAAGARAALRTLSAPWVVPIAAPAVLANPDPSVPRTHLALSEAQVAAQLPAADVQAVRTNQRSVTEYRSMVTDADDVPLDFQQAPTRQLSAYFRGRQPQWQSLADRVNAQVKAAVESVTVVSSGSVTISGESGSIPVTVSNEGIQAVTVGLVFTSTPPQLFQAEPVEPFTIEPDRRRSIEVDAKVAGSTNIPVEIQLVGADGREIGEPTVLVVRSAAYAKAARVIVQLSLALLVLAVLVHGVRRARRAVRKSE